MAGRDAENPRAAGPVDKKIGARIRARRLEIGMSQETLASKLGITFQQVQKYEKGVNRVAAVTLLDIAEALDTPLLALLPVRASEGTGQSMLDDPELSELVPLVKDLNADGRRVLAGIARTLAREPKLSLPDRRRRD